MVRWAEEPKSTGAGSLLIRNIGTLVHTDNGTIEQDVDLQIENGRIAAIGRNLALRTATPSRVIDGSSCAVYPGFINTTHHHLFQCLTRNLPAIQNAKLFDWLTALYQIWRCLTPEAIAVATQVGLGELLLSGCTTSTDHLYLFPAGAPQEWIDIEIETAREMGMRFYPTRGSMSCGKSAGRLPPDEITQKPDQILADSVRLIEKYHDPSPFAMCRVALAPCAPFSVTEELLRETAALARSKGVLLHTHLAETLDEENYCLRRYGIRPLEYMRRNNWTGPDVWYAHGIYFDDEEIRLLAQSGTGIAHCPASNLRLGSGICRVPRLLQEGVKVGLAVDGSSSNDSGNFVREMQLALLVHRVATGVEAMPGTRVLRMATIGGAELLSWPEIGRLRPGCAADLAMFRLDRLDFAGAMHDPSTAILFCGAGLRAEYTIVNGEVLVEHGQLTRMDEARLVARTNEIAARLVRG